MNPYGVFMLFSGRPIRNVIKEGICYEPSGNHCENAEIRISHNPHRIQRSSGYNHLRRDRRRQNIKQIIMDILTGAYERRITEWQQEFIKSLIQNNIKVWI